MNVTVQCLCPPNAAGEARHPGGDTITLRDRLDFRAAATARNAIVLAKTDDPEVSSAEILAILTETYLLAGVEAWTLVDEKGKPIEVTKAAIRERLLPATDQAMEVGNAADGLYAAAVMLPLLRMAANSSQPMPTIASTSPTKPSSQDRPKPSRRSSTTTTPTAATATISPLRAGVSS